MLTRHVVEHEVEHEAHVAVVQLRREVLEVVHGAEVGPHRAVVGHGVATVVVAVAGAQQRHQVQVAHPELVEVGQVRGDARQVVGEPLGVGGVADHGGVLEPVGAQHPLEVAHVQPVGPHAERGRRELDEVGAEQGSALGAVDAR